MKITILLLILAHSCCIAAGGGASEVDQDSEYADKFIQKNRELFAQNPIAIPTISSGSIQQTALAFSRWRPWGNAENFIILTLKRLCDQTIPTPENQYVAAQLLYSLIPLCSQEAQELEIVYGSRCNLGDSILMSRSETWFYTPSTNIPVYLAFEHEPFNEKVRPIVDALLALEHQCAANKLVPAQYATPLALIIAASFTGTEFAGTQLYIQQIQAEPQCIPASLFHNKPLILEELIAPYEQ